MLGADDFLGQWRLTRQIEDRRGGQPGHFEGQAVFVPSIDGLEYSETGTLRFGNGPALMAVRRYDWRFGAEGVDVRFDHGGAFHHFVPQGCSTGSDHPCGADFYRVRYDFTSWPQWDAIWDVTGPRKDYTLHSHYTPA